MTERKMKKIVGSRLKISPLKLSFIRTGEAYKKATITDYNNGKMLRDLNITSFELINANKKTTF